MATTSTTPVRTMKTMKKTRRTKSRSAGPAPPPQSKQALPRTDLATLATTQGEQGDAKTVDSERRWARLLAREPAEDQDERAGDAAEAPEARPGPATETAELDAPRLGWKREERVPLRPETKAQETARYPERLARYEEAQRIAESRKGHEAEDALHRETCTAGVRCEHPGHVAPRRALKSETRRDRYHLGHCDQEEGGCPTDDDSHLLPPHPLDVAQEYCCEHRCYPRTDVRSVTDCVSLRAPVRRQRQRDARRFGKDAFTVAGGGFVGAVVVLTPPPFSEGTLWGLSASRTVYDPATVPLREG